MTEARPVRRLLLRGPLGVLSQGLSSVSNLVLGLSIARASTPAEYGAWAVAYTGYAVSLHFTRAVASTPLMLTGDASRRVSSKDVSGGLGASILVGLLGGTVMLVIAAAVMGASQSLAIAFLSFGLGLPLLLFNDMLRYVFFRDARPAGAALMDLVWLVTQGLGLVYLERTNQLSLASGTIGWVVAATVATGVGLAWLRVLPRLRSTRDFLREQRGVSARLVIDSSLTAVSSYLVPSMVAAISGLAAAGALRAGQTLMGGVSIVVMGLTPVLTLESRRALERGLRGTSIMWRWSLVLGVVSGLYGILVLFLPDSLGRELVGKSWVGASALLLPLVIQTVTRGPYTSGPVLMKAMGDLNGLIRLRVHTSVPSLACPAVGAVIAGAPGAAWGLLVGALITDLQCTWFVKRTARRLSQTSDSKVAEAERSPEG